MNLVPFQDTEEDAIHTPIIGEDDEVLHPDGGLMQIENDYENEDEEPDI